MLRITQSNNAAGAASYFDEGLRRTDYYIGEEQSAGKWGGKLVERLGLEGEINRDDFVALCHNKRPDGSQLNPRHSQNRKTGYDFTFSVPKSVSVAWAVGGDERIRHAFEQSVEATMRELEQNMRTQTGQGKQKQHTPTGEMIWGSFTHRTSRPIDGIPSPHLHRHCFAMNTTWNAKEGRFQAGEFGDIKRKAAYYEAAFNARMAAAMKQMGYTIERKGRSWGLGGIDRSLVEKFSPRTREIEQKARQEEQAKGPLTAKQKERLGALTRAKKTGGKSWEELRGIWKGWMSNGETDQVTRTITTGQQIIARGTEGNITANEAVESARAHIFQRKSATRQDQLAMQALHRGYGDVLPEQVHQVIQTRSDFHQKDKRGDSYITTTAAIQEEIDMIDHVRTGRGKYQPLHASYTPKTDYLNNEQQQAIHMTLSSTNNVMIVAGGAGVGKTTLVREIRDAVEETGRPFVGVAPSSKASRDVMRSEGFEKADTMAQLIHNPKMQAQCKDGVIWCDEAGMIGNTDMNKLFNIAREQNARLLLTGDIRQHSAVSAGDALRILEKEAGIPVARVNKIQRQRNSLAYKKAVRLASDDKIDAALHQLDRMGDVVEAGSKEERLNKLVGDYVEATSGGKTGLIVSPTHRESREVTTQLRTHLQAKGQLGQQERVFTRLKATNWTEEQKRDAASYRQEKLVMEFHQNAQGHQRGERWQLEATESARESTSITAQQDGQRTDIPLSLSQRFTVYQEESISVAKGDRIRITKGSKTREGTRLNNGDLFTVKGFTRDGHIKLHTGKTLSKDFGHLAYGYCTTSHSSQGKTVDQVFIAQSSTSLPASSRQQFYVSISRGRERCRIYTDDKRALEDAVKRNGQRMTAREVAGLDRRRRKARVQPTRETSNQRQQSPNYGKDREL